MGIEVTPQEREDGAVKRIVILAFDRVQSLDVFGPAEVFDGVGRIAESGYAVDVMTPRGRRVRTSSGIEIGGRPLDEEPLDTLVVAGGRGVRAAVADENVVDWVRRAAGRARRTTSVCTGAFVLAQAGLLGGRRATTHWASCEALQREYPAVDVDPEPIYVRDGDVATSAGVTAGMDLALALVEEDHGPAVALEVARWLVLFLRRPGGQAQFSAGLAAQAAVRAPLRDLQGWMADHLDEGLSVAALAGRAHMSPRTFARAFRREVGLTPAAYVEALRVERARGALESTDLPVEVVAHQCGFGTVETLRRAFGRRVGVAPSAYRDRFRDNPPKEPRDGDRNPAV
jgi:transcriptional regulator GlxA family with amidase domain